MPQLRHSRTTFAASPSLDLSSLPAMPTLQTLVLRNLPPTVTGVDRLSSALPELKELTIGAEGLVKPDGDLLIPSVECLTIESPVLPQWIEFPQTLRWLSLHVPDASLDRLQALISACPEQLDSLGLRGHACIGCAVLGPRALSTADLSRCRRHPHHGGALQRFADQRPGLRYLPKSV